MISIDINYMKTKKSENVSNKNLHRNYEPGMPILFWADFSLFQTQIHGLKEKRKKGGFCWGENQSRGIADTYLVKNPCFRQAKLYFRGVFDTLFGLKKTSHPTYFLFF